MVRNLFCNWLRVSQFLPAPRTCSHTSIHPLSFPPLIIQQTSCLSHHDPYSTLLWSLSRFHHPKVQQISMPICIICFFLCRNHMHDSFLKLGLKFLVLWIILSGLQLWSWNVFTWCCFHQELNINNIFTCAILFLHFLNTAVLIVKFADVHVFPVTLI